MVWSQVGIGDGEQSAARHPGAGAAAEPGTQANQQLSIVICESGLGSRLRGNDEGVARHFNAGKLDNARSCE